VSRLPAQPVDTSSTEPRPHADREIVRMAVWAELNYLIIILVPLVPLVLLGGFVLGPVFAACLGATLALTMWWGVQAGASAPSGQSPEPGAPLHRWVDEVCTKLNAPRIDRIILTDELNAAAYQTMGFLSIVGTRRIMLIGVPLLRLMTEAEIRAVIAHEVGHFSRDHGRLGHWVYLVRSKWEHYLSEWAGDGFVDRMLKRSAAHFVPRFLERSSAWSIRCEYEADALAARATGNHALAEGLCRLEWVGHWLQHDLQVFLDRCQQLEADAPMDFWDRVHRQMAELDPASFVKAVEGVKERKKGTFDTHPPLPERLAALGLTPAPPRWDRTPAGLTLLGGQWAKVLGVVHAHWKDHASQSWRFEHVRKRWLHEQIGHARDPLGQAIFAEQLERGDATLEKLRGLAEAHPEHAQAQFELGLALLHRKSDAGRERIRAAIKLDRRLAVKGYRAVLDAMDKDAAREEVEAAAKRLDAAIQRQHAVMDGLWRRIALDGNFWALPRHAAELLTASFGQDPFLDGCWALQTQCADGDVVWPLTLLIPRVQFERLQQFGLNEDQLRQRYAYLAEAISAPEQSVFVQTVLSTEPFYPRLLEKLQGMTGTCLVAPRTRINEGVHRVDSL
jgi:Zn-dependent protease with chaperone function